MADDAPAGDEPIISDDPQGTAPPEPPSDDEPRFVDAQELLARAAEFDEATFGKPAEGSPDAPAEGAEPTAPIPGAAALDPSVQAILRQNAELIEAVKSLSSRPGTGAEVQDPVAAARAASPEIKQLESDIASTDNENGLLAKANQQMYNQLGNLEAGVLRLEGQLEATPPEDRLELQQKYNQKADQKNRLISAMDRNDERIQRNNGNLSALKKEYAATLRQVSKDVEAQKEEEAQIQADKVAVIGEFDGALAQEAKAYGIDPQSKTFAHLHRTIKSEIHTFVSTRDPEADGVDISAAVRLLFKQAAETYNLGQRRALAAASTTKLNNRASVRPQGTRLPSPTSGAFARRPTLLEVRARRDFILSGGRA